MAHAYKPADFVLFLKLSGASFKAISGARKEKNTVLDAVRHLLSNLCIRWTFSFVSLQAIEGARGNVKWMEKNYEIISAWLQKHKWTKLF